MAASEGFSLEQCRENSGELHGHAADCCGSPCAELVIFPLSSFVKEENIVIGPQNASKLSHPHQS